jgi:serine/threonine protein kinase
VGITGAVPAVYDIFLNAQETQFSMEYIDGISAVQAILTMPHPDVVWLQILAQTSLLLGLLERDIHLDHRDLKANNIWIRLEPVDYTVTLHGRTWQVKAPFQVVLLDFGFACLGSEEGKAHVSLNDDPLPLLDPCPKEGRDLFQLMSTTLGLPPVRALLSGPLLALMDAWLSYNGTEFSRFTKGVGKAMDWVYITVKNARFRYPPLHPVALLEKLAQLEAGVTILSTEQ